MNDKVVCARPFTHLQIDDGGVSYSCCPGWMAKPVGVVSNDSLSQLWNSESAQQIRKSVLDSTFRFCNAATCINLSSRTGQVGTLEQLKSRGIPLRVLEDMEMENTNLEYGPRSITCSYDRSCNLACPMCRSEVMVHQGAKKDEVQRIQQWLIDNALGDAEELYISNTGDALASPYFRRWLRTMTHDQAKGLKTIGLGTNATIWSERVWNSLSSHARSKIRTAHISIDAATPETYHRLRVGGRWERLMSNLAFVSELRRSGQLRQVFLVFVVQTENFTEMEAFVRMRDRFGFDQVQFGILLQAWGQDLASERDRYRDNAIHLPDHPRHLEFLQVLRDLNVADDDTIELSGGLHELALSNGPTPRDLEASAALSTYDAYLTQLERGLAELVALNGRLHTGLSSAIESQESELRLLHNELEQLQSQHQRR